MRKELGTAVASFAGLGLIILTWTSFSGVTAGQERRTFHGAPVRALALAPADTLPVSHRGAEGSPSSAIQPKAGAWNMEQAAKHLDERVRVWFAFAGADRGLGADKISCISCHSVLPYTLARPALRKLMGLSEPTAWETKIIEQTRRRVAHWGELDSEKYRLFYDFSDKKKKESWGTEAVIDALVLAFDDHYRGRKLPSEATAKAFTNLWQTQAAQGDDKGSWDWLDFGLEPWETSRARYFGATLAALAVGMAPGYQGGSDNSDATTGARANVELLRAYLRSKSAGQSLNNRVWLLWASAKLEGLLTPGEQSGVLEAILKKQQPDGGWSLSSLGTISPSNGFVPDANSDGYATGLIMHVLQTAGLDRSDTRIVQGLQWLESHQASTGEWRANSVNKKRDPESHAGKFMSDAATAYSVLALSH
jgi:squalene-hopene/tetraprenyl-beta-curcumene cyclase